MLWEQGVEAPTRRSELYDAIFELLLEGHHKDPSVAIPSTADVRQALGYLAYTLTHEDLLAEEPERLVQRLWNDELNVVRSRLVKVKLWGENLRGFLDAVHERTYVLGPHDGQRAAWRFWHRTFVRLYRRSGLRRSTASRARMRSSRRWRQSRETWGVGLSR